MVVNSTGLKGTVPSPSTLISTGITAAGTISAATGTTAGLLAAIGIGAQAVPIVGTIIGGVALLVGALGLGNGCGATCTESTQVVNKVEPYLQQNLAAAQQQAAQNGGCLTSAEVATATSTFQQLWNYVLQSCGQIPAPGGTQCISDRQSGGKIDWFKMYLSPIQAMPVCSVSSAAGIEGEISSVASEVASDLGVGGSLILWGGALLLGYVLWESL